MTFHPFVNPKADGADATITRPSNWNEMHVGKYATGAFTVVTGTYVITSNHLNLTGSQRLTM